jgi:metacaspase-1
MSDKLKAKRNKNSATRYNTTGTCLNYHKLLSSTSKHTGGKKLACSDCRRELLVPSKTTTNRCYECEAARKSISGFTPSRENSLGAKLFNQDQLRNASTNASGHSSSLLSTARIGNKRAVLCGVTYSRRRYMLKGTVNDVANMKKLLVNNFAFPIESIRILTGICYRNFFLIQY